MHAAARTWLTAGAVALTLLLGGCALPRMIDSDVQSFTGSAPALQGATYRFERLPSQQGDGVARNQLEATAEQALTQAGLNRDDAQPRYLIQVALQIDVLARYPQHPAREHGLFGGFGMGGGVGIGTGSLFLLMEPPWYRHTVHLVLRERTSGQVAYETGAVFEGPWSDTANLLPVLFEAALRDYPTPPAGPRKVVIELPRGGATAP